MPVSFPYRKAKLPRLDAQLIYLLFRRLWLEEGVVDVLGELHRPYHGRPVCRLLFWHVRLSGL